MPTTARILSSPHTYGKPTTCRVDGSTCRQNVRKWSIDAVPEWMVWLGIVAASFGIGVIGVTW